MNYLKLYEIEWNIYIFAEYKIPLSFINNNIYNYIHNYIDIINYTD